MTVLLNLASPSAIYAHETLCGLGFSFYGLDPLGQYEHAVFFSGDSETPEMKATPILEDFLKELDYVRK